MWRVITERAPSAAALYALVSPDVGVVHRVDAGVTGYDHPRLAPTFAQVCNTEPLFGHAHPARAGGMAEDPDRSELAALGESVERYSAASVPRSRLHRAAPGELAEIATVPPDWLDATSAVGPVWWSPGRRLRPVGPAEPAWVAASRVYLAKSEEAGRVPIATSSGLACHSDPWRALRSALLEVIERDAVMITWLTQAPVTPIAAELRWIGPRGNPVRFDRAVEQYRLYLLDSPVAVPVVFAVAFGSDGQPGAAVGAAASLDLAAAARKALVEAHQTMHWAAHMMVDGQDHHVPDNGVDTGFQDLDEHVAYYLDPGRVGAFDFLRTSAVPALPVELSPVELNPVELNPVELSPGPADGSAAEADCREIVARADAAGLDCFAVDVTAPDVRSAGLWVIRAVLPGLYPLIVGRERPDHPRLRADTPINPDPHPFP